MFAVNNEYRIHVALYTLSIELINDCVGVAQQFQFQAENTLTVAYDT